MSVRRRLLLPIFLVLLAAGCAAPNESTWIGPGVQEVIGDQPAPDASDSSDADSGS